MTERISVTITAQDGASRTFTAVGNAAEKMGDQVERAGTEGSKGLKQVDDQARTTGASLDTIRERATALGAAFGTLVSSAALLGVNFRDQQRQVNGINALYGDQADAILEMSERIQDFTRYSNDAAREGALIASSLATNYGMTADQISTLVERSADLAQIFGMDLADAVQRTAGALRGEGEAAERLGLNMSDAAVAARALEAGITNWNVPGALSEAEKAAFRFQVFLEDTADTTGAAAAAADDAGGSFRRFVNEMDDAAESVGGFLGPIGEVAAEMAPIAMAAPLVAAGIGRITPALAGLRTASMAFIASPLGLTITALGGALALATGWFLKNRQEAAETAAAYAEVEASADSLAEAIRNLALADLFGGQWARNAQNTIGETIRGFGEILDSEIEALVMGDSPIQQAFETWLVDEQGVTDATERMREAFARVFLEGLQVTPQQEAAINDALRAFVELEDVVGDITFDVLQGQLDGLVARWQAGTITTDQFTSAVNYLAEANREAATSLEGVDVALQSYQAQQALALTLTDSAIAAEAEHAAAIDTTADAAERAAEQQAAAAGMIEQGTTAAQEAAAAYADFAEQINVFEDMTQSWLDNGDNFLDFWLQFQANLRGVSSEWAKAKGAALDAGTVIPTMPNLSGMVGNAFIEVVHLADALDDAGEELDSVLNTFRQIDDLGQRSAAAGSIAETLVGERGVWAEIDEMYQRWIASGMDATEAQARYNETVRAGYAIQSSNLRVQQTLNEMRADQLPLLEAEQLAYERQIEAISQLPPLEQRRALAMQDSAVQAQLASQYATAYSASLGEIPPEVATNMIVSAAEADPVLKDLLLQFGLIEEGADGTITVNFPDGPTVQDTITQLTASIDALIITLGGVPPLHLTATDDATPVINDVALGLSYLDATTADATLTATDSASGTINTAQSNADDFDATTATATLTASDAASGVIQGVANALNALDGRTATTYVRSVTIGGGIVGPTEFRHGGIPGYASGGVIAELAEAGPEVLHFATGGSIPVMGRGLYEVPVGTYVQPHNAVSNDFGGTTLVYNQNAPVYGVDDLNERFREFGMAIVAETNRHRIAAGVA